MTRRTLAGEVIAQGITLHAGAPARATLAPAAPDTGIVFRRRDVPGSPPIQALWSNVVETRLGTVIAAADGTSVAVVEHLMSALAGAGIDDCLVEVDGPELPILDGDALSYLMLIEEAGTREQEGVRRMLRVCRIVEAVSESAGCRLLPAEDFELAFEIAFDSAAIRTQAFEFQFSPEAYRKEIAPARTFGFLREAEVLRAAGLARGADLTNTLVIDGGEVINASLMRFPDEFVRHKILDAIGDMRLAGFPLAARFEGRRSSHALNNALLRALFSDPANFQIVA